MSADNQFVPLGPPAPPMDVPAFWRRRLSPVRAADNSAAFFHIVCPSAAPWAAALILHTMVSNAGFVVYVLPDRLSVEIAECFLGDHDGLMLGETLRVMTYTDLHGALRTAPLPDFLRAAIVVLDTDFGRVSSMLLVAPSKLVSTWEGLLAKNEPLGCAAVVVSPSSEHLWDDGKIQRLFNTSVTELVLAPVPAVSFMAANVDSNDSVEQLVEAIAQLADKGKLVTVASRMDPRLMGPVQRGLEECGRRNDGSLLAPTTCFVLTPSNFWAEWQAVAGVKAPALVVLLVDQSLRFLPPMADCHFVQLPESSFRIVDMDIPDVVVAKRGLSRADICLTASMSQAELSRTAITTATAASPLPGQWDLASWPEPPRSSDWPAWNAGAAETLLCLITDMGGGRLGRLALDIPNTTWLRELIRRLRAMKLVETAGPDDNPSVRLTRFRLCGPRAQRVASLLCTGFAATLQESLLIAEIERAPSDNVKRRIAWKATALRLHASSPPVDGPLTDATHLDRLGGQASPYRRRYHQILQHAAPGLAAAETRRLTEEEYLAVDAALFRALLEHMTTLITPNLVVQLVAGRRIGYKAVYRTMRGSGEDVVMSAFDTDSRVAVHFGLRKEGDDYITDHLYVVSGDAAYRVFSDLFPDSPDGDVPDYIGLLTGRPQRGAVARGAVARGSVGR